MVNDFWDTLYTRRAYRQFKPDPVPDEKIEKILDAARWAPTDENLQFVRFIVVRDPEMKQLLTDSIKEMRVSTWMSKDYDRMDSRLWYLPKEERLKVSYALTHGTLMSDALTAPVLIVPCYTTGFWDFPTQHRSELSMLSAGLAIQNIWLATTALGLGTAFIGAPFSMDERRREIAADILGIPRTWIPMCALPIGVPERIRYAGPTRFPLESIVYDEMWGRPYIRSGLRKR